LAIAILQDFGLVVFRCAIAVVLLDLTVSEKTVLLSESFTVTIACPDTKLAQVRVITSESDRKLRLFWLLSE
jgi:hypothetical protein